MTTLEHEDRLAGAKQQGQAQFDSIVEMVDRLRVAEAIDDPDALSVEVRNAWHLVGDSSEDCEYRILLCTGGPAVQIVGDLDEYCQPTTARMQVQDWFQPWTDFRPLVAKDDYDSEPTLLAYARVFYFGE